MVQMEPAEALYLEVKAQPSEIRGCGWEEWPAIESGVLVPQWTWRSVAGKG